MNYDERPYYRLLQFISYSPTSGVFRCTNTGREVGCVRDGYLHLSVPGTRKRVKAHRYAWYYIHRDLPPLVDHIDRDTLNNRIDNLRPATKSQNAMNANIPSDNTSGVRGVSWDKSRQKWRAYITLEGRTLAIGRYRRLQDAVEARVEHEKRLFKGYAPTP